MVATPQGKHCAKCDRVVHDLTRASASEALGLASLFGARRFCARVRLDEDGEAVFRVPRSPGPLRARLALAVVGVGAGACGSAPPLTPSPPAPAVAEPAEVKRVVAVDAPSSEVARAPDADGDGVADAVDECPDAAGPAPEGCPRVVVTSSGDMVIIQTVRFEPAGSTFSKEGELVLQATLEVLQSHPEIRAVEVHGHTDGREASADALSQKRAQRVVDWLVKRGVDGGRLIPIGDGNKRPVDDNSSAEGRAKNRRIEFRVIPDPATGSST